MLATQRAYGRIDWPLAKLQVHFKNDTLALIGCGSQGHGQGLNTCDNGLDVVVGVCKNGESWNQAVEAGWVPGETLLIEEAINRGTIIMNLLSDAAQSATWPSKVSTVSRSVSGARRPFPSWGPRLHYLRDFVIDPADVDPA